MSNSRMASSNGSLTRLSRRMSTKAAQTLRNREAFTRDDGTPLNYTLVDIEDWCKNTFEVINQLRINTDYSHHRYDVILLINGVPVVQIELKTLAISPRKAMEQIVEYKNDPGNGYTKTLLCFVQLFIVSNRVDTLYFANNNARHFSFNADERFLPVYRFAAEDNTRITHLDDFADRFLAKCTLSEMISKYMVLIAGEQKLLMMRAYQIYAVQAIVDCIDQNGGNGYIWHTTGSGKTLTSFKASTLLKSNHDIHKCLFVVDRKDLDRQTRDEFNKFQANCVEENTNTAALVHRLESNDYADKVIVTTIQKLGLALTENGNNNQQKTTQGQPYVHAAAGAPQRQADGVYFRRVSPLPVRREPQGPSRSSFRTPSSSALQAPQSSRTMRPSRKSREKSPLFELPGISSRKSFTPTPSPTRSRISTSFVSMWITTCLRTPRPSMPGQNLTKQAVARAILNKHNAATGERRFNALLATASINDAIEYYEVFKKLHAQLQADNPESVPLKIAAVFSPPAEGNKDVQQIQEDLPQEKEDNRHDPEGKKTALSAIIADYNERYGTNHDINSFDLYYQDVQQRIKDQQYPNSDLPEKGAEKIDVTIVVDMLLTGFDAVYLNTLYVDKNLRHHGLIQAFSRTNRILNATKPYGHILDFRQQQDCVDAAIALFSGAQPDRAREIWLVDRAPVVIENFEKAVADLGEFLQSQGLEFRPDQVNNLKGDDARVQFIKRFKVVQSLQTQLNQYTDLTDVQTRADRSTPSPTDDLPSLPRRLPRNRTTSESPTGHTRWGRQADHN